MSTAIEPSTIPAAQATRPGVGADPPLRIGLMLRAVDDVDGQGIYIRELCDALFDADQRNEYVAFYWKKEQLGRYADRPNVREVLLPGRQKLIWDQLQVPWAARRERLDVLFHHKFSVPLLAPCPTVVQQRGTEFWSHPEFYTGWSGRLDRWYNRLMIPLYCRRSARVLTNSDSLADELVHWVGVPRPKLRTVYGAADARFRRVEGAARLERVRSRYHLPDQPFLLMVVKGHQILGQTGGKALTPRKNVQRALEAYGRMRQQALAGATGSGGRTPPPLVILGIGIAERLPPGAIAGITDPAAVHTPGFVEFDDMPAIYSLARALVFPSRYESFGIPIVEAMACGCPVITSTAAACPEVAGDAAVLVDPDNVAGLSDAMARVAFSEPLVSSLRQRGLRRARQFSWTRSALSLLGELRGAARPHARAA